LVVNVFKSAPRRILRGDTQEKVAGIAEAGGLAMTAMMIWSINNGRLPESQEDIEDAMSEQAAASIPMIGSAVVNGLHGYDTQLQIHEIATDAGKLVAKAKDGETLPFEDYQKFAWENLAPFAGVPVIALGRTKEAIEEEDIIRLTGIKKKEKEKPGKRKPIGRRKKK
jgi:hypothetical protein